MLDNEPDRVETNAPGRYQSVDTPSDAGEETAPRRVRRRATKSAKAGDAAAAGEAGEAANAGEATKAKKAAKATRSKRSAAVDAAVGDAGAVGGDTAPGGAATDEPPVKATRRRRKAAPSDDAGESGVSTAEGAGEQTRPTRTRRRSAAKTAAAATPGETAGSEPDSRPAGGGAEHGGQTDSRGAVASDRSVEPAGQAAESGRGQAAESGRGQATESGRGVERADVGESGGAAQPESGGGAPERGRRRRPVLAVPVFMAPVEQDPVPAQRPAAVAERPAEVADASSEIVAPTRRRRGRRSAEPVTAEAADAGVAPDPMTDVDADESPRATSRSVEVDDDDDDDEAAGRRRRRRGRRGRGRGRGTGVDDADDDLGEDEPAEPDEATQASSGQAGEDEPADGGESLTRRRRRRRRKGAADSDAGTESPNVVVRIREPRSAKDEVQSVSGSTRLEAKRQRRRDGREQRRTRPAILSESEFLARREAVDRVMVVRQRNDRTQIAVLEDGVLVEHYVARASAATMVGNVYLGRVQNVLPSMEAAFIDLGRGRNAVLYAGEVNWEASGLEGRTRTIEQALKSGDSVLVQVTKDPIGTKGARLTSHIALSGRHLVFVPNGNASGISRKLSDVERKRLRDILKNLVPDGAGVIVRTAAEGASEDDLARDVTRLQAQWEGIRKRSTSGNAPALLYEEPDLVIRVVRDLFNEDFRELVVQSSNEYEMIESYLGHVSPDLLPRLRRHTGVGDVFAELRIDEQIIKGLDRKVYLPSGGSLVIDRTEAMTVIDVNTGKYTGAGGNLEETVTRNNLEAAEEIVRQLRLRDLGGIIVIDFIDMVLESNRELVLRRLTECLGRDRTKHQVTEITSLGLVQMTRKRAGQGLLEAFSETCEVCKGRGLIMHTEPVPDRRGGGGGGGGSDRSGVAKIAAATLPAGTDGESAGGTDTGNGSGNGAAGGHAGNGSSGGQANGGESSRSARRRGRRAAAAAASDAGASDAGAPDAGAADAGASGAAASDPAAAGDTTPAEPAVERSAVATVPTDGGGAEPDRDDAPVAADGAEGSDGDDTDDDAAGDDLAAVGGRRRSRRGGTRRRTRP